MYNSDWFPLFFPHRASHSENTILYPPPSLQFLFHKNIPFLDSFLLKIVKNDKTEFLMSFCKIDGGGSYNCVFRIGQINQRYLICFGKIFSPFQEIKFSGFEPDQNTIS